MDDFSDVQSMGSGRAKSSSRRDPRRSNPYRRKPADGSRKEAKTAPRNVSSGPRSASLRPFGVGSQNVSSRSRPTAFGAVESIQFLCDFVKRPRDTRRWQPGYVVTPKTAMTHSPRSVSPAFVEVDVPIDQIRFRKSIDWQWGTLVRRAETGHKEEQTETDPFTESQKLEMPAPENADPLIPVGTDILSPKDNVEVEPEAWLTNTVNEEEARMSVFKQLQHDGEIHQESLLEALALLDFPKPDQSWVSDIVPTITNFTCLNSDDFLLFVKVYDERQTQAYQAAFSKYDDDGSGSVDVSELAAVLKEFGVTPLPGVLEENIAEVDVDGSGQLDVKEFIQVLELQKSRDGFTKSEIEEFQKAFKKFDRDRSGEVSASELIGILGWLGYAQRPEVVRSIAQRADTDGTGDLSWTEMLTCMRWIREAEVKRVEGLLHKYDVDGSGEVDAEELLPLLKELGYSANAEAIRHAAEDAHLGSDDNSFDFNELWKLLHVFRRRCGFTRAEDAELTAAHKKYDSKNEGFIDTLELGKALRQMGYSVTPTTQKQLLDLVDVDGSGKLDLAEFRTLMRMRREHELQEVRDVFQYYCPGDETKLALANLPKALRRAGFTKSDVHTELDLKIKMMGRLTFDQFWKIVSDKLKEARERMHQNAGFTSAEVSNLRTMFIEFDYDGSGDIAGAELRKLMRTIFPDASASAADRKFMEDILNDIDRDGNGSIDFGDFLRLMRHYCDELDKKHEESLLEGFTVDEVQQFREIYDDENLKQNGHLSTQVVLGVIQRICPLGAAARGELSKFVAELQHRANVEYLDFNGFLQVMRHVIDVDLGGINEQARLIAAADDAGIK